MPHCVPEIGRHFLLGLFDHQIVIVNIIYICVHNLEDVHVNPGRSCKNLMENHIDGATAAL